MKLSVFLLFSGIFTLSANVNALSQKVTLKVVNVELREVFRSLEQQTGHIITYSEDRIDSEHTKITADFENIELQIVLDRILKDLPYTYSLREQRVFIIPAAKTESTQLLQTPVVTIRGKVTDEGGRPLDRVSVIIKGTRHGAATDAQGNFFFNYPATEETIVVFSYLGKKTVEVLYKEGQALNVVMKETASNVDEVVVTGLYTRSKESFTGSAATFSRKELQSISNTNILQSLKTLDPSFAIIESNEFGSDPNRLPDIEIRGKTSVVGLTEEFGSDPNQPLFILDGFESTLRAISDLNMNMVESITILKDAASTAIYGSKSANGVIVVETRRPEIGQLRINYKGDFSISFPDLSDYNLMNAKEKLEFERLSLAWGAINENGMIESESNYIDYMRAYKEVERGVNTYWLHLPTRMALTNRHNLYVEGGTPEIRYGISVNYGNTAGVMKGSDRETTGGSFRFMYRKGSFSFNNILTVDNVTAKREKVEFSRFARMSPYFRKYSETGEIPKQYIRQQYNAIYTTNNPLWDMSLNSYDKTTQFGFSNSLELEWRIHDELRVRGRFGIGKIAKEQVIFTSPFHTGFINSSQEETGSYTQYKGDQFDYNFNYNGDASITYAKLLNDIHRIHAVGGFNFRQDNTSYAVYTVTGFIDEDYPNPNFALGYKPDSKPTYMDSKRRSASYYINTGYSFRERYLLDANYRLDGTSIFGSSKRFAHTWSVGLAWNIHNEAFLNNPEVVNNIKLRASIGNPGNQNFSDYISIMVYKYNLNNPNVFGPSMIIDKFGNPDLNWQKTIDKNIGFDLGMFDNRLRIYFDYFHKDTDPLLVYIGTPSSTGITKIPKNLGKQVQKGMTATVIFQIIANRDITWAFNVNMRSLKSHYEDIGDQLNKFNMENFGSSLTRYYDGGSPTAIWAVRSLGIDPATGREILLKKDGNTTFLYDYDDEVVVGDKDPDVEGVFGMYFRYKNLSAGFNFRYRLGGQAFMDALYNKVEKIGDRFANQDRRALYDRWNQCYSLF